MKHRLRNGGQKAILSGADEGESELFQDIESSLKHPSKVWGASLDPTDIIADNVILPEMRLGDSLVFPDMGAYTLVCASNFNRLPHPVCRYYKRGELHEWIVTAL